MIYLLYFITVTRVNAEDATIDKVVRQKLSVNGIFSRWDACVEPVKGKEIEKTIFEFENCWLTAMFGGPWDFTTQSYLGGGLSQTIHLIY